MNLIFPRIFHKRWDETCRMDFYFSETCCVQEYSFQITMRQEWNDRRLSYEERLTSKMKGTVFLKMCIHNCTYFINTLNTVVKIVNYCKKTLENGSFLRGGKIEKETVCRIGHFVTFTIGPLSLYKIKNNWACFWSTLFKKLAILGDNITTLGCN